MIKLNLVLPPKVIPFSFSLMTHTPSIFYFDYPELLFKPLYYRWLCSQDYYAVIILRLYSHTLHLDHYNMILETLSVIFQAS